MKKKVLLLAPFVLIGISILLFVYRNIFVVEPTFAELQQDAKGFIPSGVTMLTQDQQQNLSMWDLDGDQLKEGIAVYEYPNTKQKEILVMKKKIIGYEVIKTPIYIQDEIKEVRIQDMSGDKVPEITIIQQADALSDKPEDKPLQKASIYQFESTSSQSTLQNKSFVEGTYIFVTDFDRNKIGEIIVFEMKYPTGDTSNFQPGVAKAKLYEFNKTTLALKQTLDLGKPQDIKPHFGKIDKQGRYGFIIDKVETPVTQVFSFIVMENGKLVDVYEKERAFNLLLMNRGFKSMLDIDRDDILDIPILSEPKSDADAPYYNGTAPIVTWVNLTPDNRIEEKARSIIGYGYDWIIPEEWKDITLINHSIGAPTYGESCLNVQNEKVLLTCIYLTKKEDIQWLIDYIEDLHIIEEFNGYVIAGYLRDLGEVDKDFPKTQKAIKENPSLKGRVVFWEKEKIDQALKDFEEDLKRNAKLNPYSEGIYEEDL